MVKAAGNCGGLQHTAPLLRARRRQANGSLHIAGLTRSMRRLKLDWITCKRITGRNGHQQRALVAVQPGDLRARQTAQTLPDGFDPLIDRAFRNGQFSANFFARQALGHIDQDLPLLVCKRVEDCQLVERIGYGLGILRHAPTGNKYICTRACGRPIASGNTRNLADFVTLGPPTRRQGMRLCGRSIWV